MADLTLDSKTIEDLVYRAVQRDIVAAVANLGQDPQWLAKVENLINQAVVQQTLARIGSIDINSIIKERVDENMHLFHEQLKKDFASCGITDQATTTQLTVMDDYTVVENNLTARDLTVAESARVQHLVVTGSINTDNQSWQALAASIADSTLKQVNTEFKDNLVTAVTEKITSQGIDFKDVTVAGEKLVDGSQLSRSITETNIQSVGVLSALTVAGETSLNNTVNILTARVGVNTDRPEMALSVWDEEVAVNLGKFKSNQAYIGTSRLQGLSLGVNRQEQLTIDTEGLTTVKKLQVGDFKISHSNQVPGWSGARGDIVFNSDPKDLVFGWMCLGMYQWIVLKSAE